MLRARHALCRKGIEEWEEDAQGKSDLEALKGGVKTLIVLGKTVEASRLREAPLHDSAAGSREAR